MLRLMDFYEILKTSISHVDDAIIGIDGKYIPDTMVHYYEHFPIRKIEYNEMFDGTISCMINLSGFQIDGCSAPIVQPIKFGELEISLIHKEIPIVPISEISKTIYWNWEYDEAIRDKEVKKICPIINSPNPMIQVFID